MNPNLVQIGTALLADLEHQNLSWPTLRILLAMFLVQEQTTEWPRPEGRGFEIARIESARLRQAAGYAASTNNAPIRRAMGEVAETDLFFSFNIIGEFTEWCPSVRAATLMLTRTAHYSLIDVQQALALDNSVAFFVYAHLLRVASMQAPRFTMYFEAKGRSSRSRERCRPKLLAALRTLGPEFEATRVVLVEQKVQRHGGEWLEIEVRIDRPGTRWYPNALEKRSIHARASCLDVATGTVTALSRALLGPAGRKPAPMAAPAAVAPAAMMPLPAPVAAPEPEPAAPPTTGLPAAGHRADPIGGIGRPTPAAATPPWQSSPLPNMQDSSLEDEIPF